MADTAPIDLASLPKSGMDAARGMFQTVTVYAKDRKVQYALLGLAALGFGYYWMYHRKPAPASDEPVMGVVAEPEQLSPISMQDDSQMEFYQGSEEEGAQDQPMAFEQGGYESTM